MNHENPDIVARGRVILDILQQLRTIALTDRTVLFIGETGVAKDRFAEYLHQKSARRFKPLVKIDMATLPRELVESELFGHEKGHSLELPRRRKDSSKQQKAEACC